MLILAACNGNGSDDEVEAPETNGESEDETEVTEEAEGVSVTLIDNDEQEVAVATLTEDENGVNIELTGENLEPGEHGFHIHDNGACEAPDFDSAGDHYNPTDANHGFDDPDGPHAGDLENIEVSEDGTISTEVTADMVTLEVDAENTLFTDDGTSLVIHSDADDYESQPSGDAGDPVACGVILSE